MSNSVGYDVFKLGFQISPIILTNGIAANVPGGLLPIISITEAANFVTGLLSGGPGDLDSLDNFFAHFEVIPGGSLIRNEIGEYPFANQQVAANAIVVQPNSVSLRMICPVKSPGGYTAKLATITALQNALAQHNISGGTYTVATPSFIYTDCVMLSMTDLGPDDSKQVQRTWQLDFRKPLVTLAAATGAQNSLLSRISAQVPVTGDPPPYSGLGPAVGNPASGVGPSVVPASTYLFGSGVSGAATSIGNPGP